MMIRVTSCDEANMVEETCPAGVEYCLRVTLNGGRGNRKVCDAIEIQGFQKKLFLVVHCS